MKALITGYYGARNLGDEMMLLCLRGWLERQGATVTILAENADEVRRSHGLPAVSNVPIFGQWNPVGAYLRGGAFRILRAIAAADIVIAGGGDCFRTEFGWHVLSYAIEKYVIAMLMRKPVCLLNVGLPRSLKGLQRKVFGMLLRRCRTVVVRDRRSVIVCQELAVTDVRYSPDIVLSLPRELRLDPPVERPNTPYLLVCLRAMPNVYGGYCLTDLRERTFAAALDHLAERGLNVVFLPFQDDGAGLNDNDIHHAIVNKMERKDRAEIRTWSDDLHAVTKLFFGSELVIAMRLHAAILAVACMRPCVSMPYDDKVTEFSQQAGLNSISADLLDNTQAILEVLNASFAGQTGRASLPPDDWTSFTL